MTITYLRHAETGFNKKGFFCGTSDCDITEDGYLLAQTLKDKFYGFDYYYCSPLKRTCQTLNAIFPDAVAIIDNRITEICLGVWEGVPKTSVNQDLRKEFQKGNFAPEGAEANESVEKRTISFLNYMFNTYSADERILVVTHNGFLRTLARLLGTKPITKNLEYFTIESADYKSLI